MPENSGRIIRRAEIALMSLVLAIAVIGLTLLPLTTPGFVHALVTLVDAEELTGLGRAETIQAAEAVRRFVLDPDAPDLPTQINGQPAFDEASSSHLIDVRNVIVPARYAALLSPVVVLLWAVARRRKPEVVVPALSGAAWVLVASTGAAALVGLADFDSFFTWFHGLFFAPGTWQFPADALLIQVFPLAFWMTSAAAWAALIVMSAALLFIFAHWLRFTRRADGV